MMTELRPDDFGDFSEPHIGTDNEIDTPAPGGGNPITTRESARGSISVIMDQVRELQERFEDDGQVWDALDEAISALDDAHIALTPDEAPQQQPYPIYQDLTTQEEVQ